MSAEEIEHLLFTYGTLKKAEPNGWLMADPNNGKAVYLGKGVTMFKYPLVVTSEYNIPFLLLIEGKGFEVEGEIYSVDDKMLLALDDFEDHPDFYQRQKTQILKTHDKANSELDPPQKVECWVYFLPRYKPEMIDLPCYKSYSSKSGDYPEYVTSEQVSSLDEV